MDIAFEFVTNLFLITALAGISALCISVWYLLYRMVREMV